MGVCLLEASAAKGDGIVAKQLSAKTLRQKIGLYLREDNSHPALHRFVDLVLLKLTQQLSYVLLNRSESRGESGAVVLAPRLATTTLTSRSTATAKSSQPYLLDGAPAYSQRQYG